MNRRSFLQTLTALLAGSQFNLGATSFIKRRKVIVIGAGIAGIAAARQLQKSGLDVLVLESRNRIGGRILTDTRLGFPIDLGAAWIHGMDDNPLTPFARQAGCRLHVTDYDNLSLFQADGSIVQSTRVKKAAREFQRLLKKIKVRAEERDRDFSVAEGLKKLLADQTNDSLRMRLLEFAMRNMEDDFAVDLEQLSAQSWNEDSEFSGEDALPAGGMRKIIHWLARGLDIRLSQRVKRIDTRGKQAVLQTDQGEFTADQVVITIPVGLLKQEAVEFIPGLPEEMTDAIKEIGVGNVIKVAARFPTVFWPEDSHFLGILDSMNAPSVNPALCLKCHGEPEIPDRLPFSNLLNLHAIFKQPILVGHVPGSFAAALEGRPDREKGELLHQQLKTVLGSKALAPEQWISSDWHLNPDSGGAYWYLKPGSGPELYEQLARPVGERLFFAGDSRSRKYPSTIHGAWLSGIQAARDIIRN